MAHLGGEALKRYLVLVLFYLPLWASVNVKEYGAHGDGVTNDTAALNNAFSTACASSDDVYIPSGIYLTDSLANLVGCGITFYGDGKNSSILKLRSVVAPSIWRLTGGPGKVLTVQDLALDGGHLPGAGISIEQYQTVIIRRIASHDFGMPGYALGHKNSYDGAYIRNVESVRITDSQFVGNERAGIELQAVHNSTVSNSVMSANGGMGGVSEQNFEGPLDGPLVAQWLDNTLEANGSGGIDVETDPKLPPAQGILLGNHVVDCGNDRWDAGWGLVIGLHSFGTIARNSVEHFASYALSTNYASAIVYGRNGGPISVLNNTIIGTKSYAIVGDYGAFPVTISGNTLNNNGAGIFIYRSPGVQITHNTVVNSAASGIDVSWSKGSIITDNQVSGNLTNLKVNGRVIR